MLRLKRKDIVIRKSVAVHEINTLANKYAFVASVFNSANTNIFRKIIFNFLRQKHNKARSKTIRRCIVTNRGRGTFRGFNVSRSKLRESLLQGEYVGYKKLSW